MIYVLKQVHRLLVDFTRQNPMAALIAFALWVRLATWPYVGCTSQQIALPAPASYVLSCEYPKLRAHFTSWPDPMRTYGYWEVQLEEPVEVDGLILKRGASVHITGNCVVYDDREIMPVATKAPPDAGNALDYPGITTLSTVTTVSTIMPSMVMPICCTPCDPPRVESKVPNAGHP